MMMDLVSALEKYGQHTADCATRTELQFDTGKMGDCDCGFADALKGGILSNADVQAAIKDVWYINDLRSQIQRLTAELADHEHRGGGL